MPEHEGYLRVINLLSQAISHMEDGEAKELVAQARALTVKLAKQSVSSLEMGMELGRLLSKEEEKTG